MLLPLLLQHFIEILFDRKCSVFVIIFEFFGLDFSEIAIFLFDRAAYDKFSSTAEWSSTKGWKGSQLDFIIHHGFLILNSYRVGRLVVAKI